MAVRRMWQTHWRFFGNGITAATIFSLVACAGIPEPILRSNAKVQLQGREASKLDVALCQQKAEEAGLKPGTGSRTGNMAAGAALGLVAGGAVGASTGLIGGATGVAIGAAAGAVDGLGSAPLHLIDPRLIPPRSRPFERSGQRLDGQTGIGLDRDVRNPVASDLEIVDLDLDDLWVGWQRKEPALEFFHPRADGDDKVRFLVDRPG